MTPIQELFNRIRWDKKFGKGQFEIGIFDRKENSIHRVLLKDIAFPEGERGILEWIDDSGRLHHIPFHRIREVYRDGQIIWRRPG